VLTSKGLPAANVVNTALAMVILLIMPIVN